MISCTSGWATVTAVGGGAGGAVALRSQPHVKIPNTTANTDGCSMRFMACPEMSSPRFARPNDRLATCGPSAPGVRFNLMARPVIGITVDHSDDHKWYHLPCAYS